MNALTSSIRLFAVILFPGILLLGNQGTPNEDKERKQALQAIADAIKDGRDEQAKALSKKLAYKEEEVYYIMLLMKPRDKKGLGVGKKAGEIQPDGIELKILKLARDGIIDEQLKKEAGVLKEMGYRLAAIAQFSDKLPPMKNRKEWLKYSKEMYEFSLDFIKAVQNDKATEVKKAAVLLRAPK